MTTDETSPRLSALKRRSADLQGGWPASTQINLRAIVSACNIFCVIRATSAKPLVISSLATTSNKRQRAFVLFLGFLMHNISVIRQAARWLVVAVFLTVGFAMAQTEPSMKEIYATAQAGKLDEAQKMITHVLVTHPNSAKAHFVQSELFARQGNSSKGREALDAAEKIAPGLPFAKPEAVQALRSQLSAKNAPLAASGATNRNSNPVTVPEPKMPSWALPLLLAGAVIAAGYFMFRRKAPAQTFGPPAYANQNGLTGPQTFGGAAAMQQPGGQPQFGQQPPGQAPYGQTPYGMAQGGQPPMGQPAGNGLGGKIMGGVATGLAVGAGMMAAQAIAKNLTGDHNQSAAPNENRSNNDFQPLAGNPDMGGQNFGINDASSWDDGGSADVGGGGDWDT